MQEYTGFKHLRKEPSLSGSQVIKAGMSVKLIS